MDPGTVPSRRAYLAGLGGLAAAVAGCAGRPGSGTATAPPTSRGTRTETRTGTATTTPERTDHAEVPELSGSWTHPDADARATRATDTDPLDAVPEQVWTAATGSDYRQVLFAGDALYTATGTRLARRSLVDGRVHLGGAPETLYFTTGEDEPTLYALGPAGTGPPTERWTRDGVRFRRADADLVVATADGHGRLRGLEPDGGERWSLDVGSVDLGIDVEGERFDSVVLGPDHVFVAVESGERRWRLDTPAIQVVPADGGLFVLGETELRLFA